MLLLLFRARKNRQPSLCTSKTTNKEELGWFDQSDGGRINDGFFFFFFF